MSDNIKVVVKLRPLIARETEEGAQVLWRVRDNTLHQIEQSGRETSPIVFTFDKVYDINTATRAVYNDIAKPIVEAAIGGINGTIFAYGQTSSGKTYTMMGDDTPGIIPLAVYDVFNIIKDKTNRDFLLRVSYIEIYNETIKDLLDQSKTKIKIHETADGAVKVDATERVTSSPQEVMETMREGEINRQVGSTNMNEKSSRSHTIFQITIESREHTESEEEDAGCVNVSQLNLVDLAGSERSGQTGATGVRFREGTHINKSLSALGLVIKQLSEDPHRFINYRDSKLTRILQNSLGGNAKTSIICTVTPAAVEETISTLQFANRAKAIKNKPEVNAVAKNATMLQSLFKKLANMQYELDSKRHVEHDNEKLQLKIKQLQHQILYGKTQSTDRVNRRKTWCAPRRFTLSSHMSSIQEENLRECALMPPPTFVTPSMKITQRVTPREVQWLSAQRVSDVAEGGEEDELVTPPNRRKNIPVVGEVITLDDSSDEQSDATCSPYHKCYETSKTPPCILRDKAKKAEINYNDLIELTEREKIYSPNTFLWHQSPRSSINVNRGSKGSMDREKSGVISAELLERLDKYSTALSNLRQENDMTKSLCEKKDKEIVLLKQEITKYEENQSNLETKLQTLEREVENYQIKVTELEVCLENCKQKAKQREIELLSLFDEKNSLIHQDKSPVQNKGTSYEISTFLNLSKDFSLVGSEVDTSMGHSESEKQLSNENITNLHSQLNEKNDLIRELNKKLANSQQSIQMYCEELVSSNNANVNMEATSDHFKQTVSDLTSKLDKANEDVKLYENIVYSLKEQLHQNEIDVENKVASNNEQISDILINLKQVLSLKNKSGDFENTDILALKTAKECQVSFDSKVKDIILLERNIQEMKELCLNYEKTIKKLSDENTELLKTNNSFIDKNKKLTEDLSELKDIVETKNKYIIGLDLDQKELISELSRSRDEALQKNKSLNKEINLLNNTISDLAANIKCLEESSCQLNNLKLKLTEQEDDLKVLEESMLSVTSENNSLKQRLLESDKCICELNKDLSSKENLIVCLKKQVIDMQSLVDEVNKQQERFSEHIDKNEFCMQEINASQEKVQLEINNLNQELHDKCNELQNANFIIQCSNAELSQLKLELQKNNILLEDKVKLEQIIDAQKAENNSLEEKIYNLTNELCDLNKKFIKFEIDRNELNCVKSQIITISHRIKKILELIGNSSIDDSNVDGIDVMLARLENWISTTKDDCDSFNKNCKNINDLEKLVSLHLDENIILKKKIKNQEEDMEKLHESFVKNEEDMHKLGTLYDDANNNLTIHKDLIEILRAKVIKTNCKLTEDISNFEVIVNQKLRNCTHSISNMENKIEIINKNVRINPLKEEYYLKINTECRNPPRLIELSVKKLNENILSRKSVSAKELFADVCTQTDVETLFIKTPYTVTANKLQIGNQHLLEVKTQESSDERLQKENEQMKEEVKLLLGLADDLHKHITKHRTQLSTLTATMHAENKLLRTKLNALQHHHNRLHGVCCREMPELREQLSLLKNLLSGELKQNYSAPNIVINECDSTIKEEINGLPDIESNEISMSKFSMPTLGSETLMLGHNFSLGPSANSTMINQDEIVNHSITVGKSLEGTDVQLCNETIQQKTEKSFDHKGDISKITRVYSTPTCCAIPLKDMDYSYTTHCENNYRESTDILHEELKKHSENCIINKAYFTMSELLATKLKELENLKNKLDIIEQEKGLLENKVNHVETLQDEVSQKDVKIKKIEKMLDEIRMSALKLQTENETLSTDIMDLLMENDALKIQLNKIETEKKSEEISCRECSKKGGNISVQNSIDVPADNVLKEFNRNHSSISEQSFDSSLTKTSLRHEKICSLHNELQASREDCKKINEEVSTIRDHLFKSENLSFKVQENLNKSNLAVDTCLRCFNKSYENDKRECINFLLSKNIDENTLKFDVEKPIIDIMKHFYETQWIHHSNEIENLLNKLKQYEEDKINLQTDIQLITDNSKAMRQKLENELKIHNELQMKLNSLKEHVQSALKEFGNLDNFETDFNLKIDLISHKILTPLGIVLNIPTLPIFNNLVLSIQKQYEHKLNYSNEKCAHYEKATNDLSLELNVINQKWDSLNKDYVVNSIELANLKEKNERLTQINKAVTLDLVAKEERLKELLVEHSEGIYELNKSLSNVDAAAQLLDILKHNRLLAEEQLVSIELIKNQNINIENKNRALDEVLRTKEGEIQHLKLTNKELNERLNHLEQNILSYKNVEEKLKMELSLLNKKFNNVNDVELSNKTEQIKQLETECAKIRAINSVLSAENKDFTEKLDYSVRTINKQKKEMDEIQKNLNDAQMSNENLKVCLDNLSSKCSNQNDELMQLNKLLNEKSELLVCCEKNVITHQKASGIQASMCKRLQKEKEDMEIILEERASMIEQLTNKCSSLQSELDDLRSLKNTIEKQIPDLKCESDGSQKSSRNSLEAVKSETRRRRQSVYDMQRSIANIDERASPEQEDADNVFDGFIPTKDLFAEFKPASQRNSLDSSSKHDSRSANYSSTNLDNVSEVIDDHVTVRRRRRQSIHDLHRPSTVNLTLSGSTEDLSQLTELQNENKCLKEEINKLRVSVEAGPDSNDYYKGEVEMLKAELERCRCEYSDLQARFQELDEECEMCAETLKERDNQCLRLGGIKLQLERQLGEMKKRLGSGDAQANTESKNASVNTEIDATWYTTVVDRMTYDAEMEKKRKLTKSLDSLSIKNRELQITVDKLKLEISLCKPAEEHTRELEKLTSELERCRCEYEELQIRYKELDEECDLCAESLKKSEHQCLMLDNIRIDLEEKIQELQQGLIQETSVTQSSRKKRQSCHDENRASRVAKADIATNTDEGALSVLGVDHLTYEAERERNRKLQAALEQLKAKNSKLAGQLRCMQQTKQVNEPTVGMLQSAPEMELARLNTEMQQLRDTIDQLRERNIHLEQRQQLVTSAPPTPSTAPSATPTTLLVATGSAIVQNQQLCDLMKENHKLKVVNAKLLKFYKKRTREANQENVEPQIT